MMGDMDHNEVRELLEDAAVEPGGLERLMAGDTPTAALVAGHLAGCPDCGEELNRLSRSVAVIRPVVRSTPPPELREQTLAYIAAVGRPRGPATAAPGPADSSVARERPVGHRFRAPVAVAAALVLAVGATGLLVSVDRDNAARVQSAQVGALADVARWTMWVEAAPDARRVALASTTGGPAVGRLIFSPSTTQVVVVADDLAPPPAGYEYRCWVEIGGTSRPIGKMYLGGGVAYWVGDVADLATVPADARFGVSLVDLAQPGTPGEPVLVGAG